MPRSVPLNWEGFHWLSRGRSGSVSTSPADSGFILNRSCRAAAAGKAAGAHAPPEGNHDEPELKIPLGSHGSRATSRSIKSWKAGAAAVPLPNKQQWCVHVLLMPPSPDGVPLPAALPGPPSPAGARSWQGARGVSQASAGEMPRAGCAGRGGKSKSSAHTLRRGSDLLAASARSRSSY